MMPTARLQSLLRQVDERSSALPAIFHRRVLRANHARDTLAGFSADLSATMKDLSNSLCLKAGVAGAVGKRTRFDHAAGYERWSRTGTATYY